MSEKRIIRATQRAIPLLEDIISSTEYLYDEHFVRESSALEFCCLPDIGAILEHGEIYVAFDKHFPIGFAGLLPVDECRQVVGPFLYREQIGRGYGSFLLDLLCERAAVLKTEVLFTLIHKNSVQTLNFFAGNSFEVISDRQEMIKRWRDGLLADRNLPAGILLLARIAGE